MSTLLAFHRRNDRAMRIEILTTVLVSMAIFQLTAAGKAPRIEPRDSVMLTQPGKYAYLACNAEGDPDPWITWERDGKPIRKFGERFSVNKDSKALRIFRLQLGDDGNYTCTAKNSYGVDSVTTSLVVLFKPEAVIITPNDFVVLERSNQEIVCRARGLPKPSFEWYTNQEKKLSALDLEVEEGEVETYKRMYIKERQVDDEMSESVLVISPVLDEDYGRYTCIATNQVGSDRDSIKLDVRFPPKIVSKHKSPKIVFWWPSHRTNLTCAVIGNDSPKITWKRNEVLQINHTSIVSEINEPEVTSTFWLSDDVLEPVGTYTCTAQNNLGSAFIHEFTVLRAFPPTSVDIHGISFQPDEIQLSVRVPTGEDTPPVTHIIASYKLNGDKDAKVERRADVNDQGEAFVKLPGVHSNREYEVSVRAVNMVGIGDPNTFIVFTEIPLPSDKQPTSSSKTSPLPVNENTEDESDNDDDLEEGKDKNDEDVVNVSDGTVLNETVTAYGVRKGENNMAASFQSASGMLFYFNMQIILLNVILRCVAT